MPEPLRRDAALVASAFAVSGVVHLVRPRTFEPLMPAWVPAHREVIYASGVAELVCAAGLANPSTRRTAGWAGAALLLAVFPGNVTMAQAALRGRSTQRKVVALGRLPLQLPLVRAMVRTARAAG